MRQFFDVLTLIVWGAMLADLVTHPDGTSTLLNGINGFWTTSMKAVNPGSQG